MNHPSSPARHAPKSLDKTSADSALSMSITVGGGSITRDQVRVQLFLPAFRPPIAAAVASEDGALWLRRENGPGDVDYTGIGANGNLLATLTVRRPVAIKAVSGNLVWTIETGEDDVQGIARYRIAR